MKLDDNTTFVIIILAMFLGIPLIISAGLYYDGIQKSNDYQICLDNCNKLYKDDYILACLNQCNQIRFGGNNESQV